MSKVLKPAVIDICEKAKILTELNAIQYISRNMHDSRFVMLGFGLIRISTRLTSLAPWYSDDCPGIILGMDSANEGRSHNVTPSFIGRAHTQNDPCCPSASEETLRRLRMHEFIVI